MFNRGVTTHMPWSPSPMVLYQQTARASHDQARRFAGAFSITSLLSPTRSEPDMDSTYQDNRYLGGIPSTPFGQHQVVCCNEGTAMHLQTQTNPSHLRSSIPGHEGSMVTYETTKLQGCLGNGISKLRPRKGNKRSRTIFTPFQLQRLEKAFERQQYVAGEERRQLAVALNLTETQVKVWFQNRRIRFRKQRISKTTTS